MRVRWLRQIVIAIVQVFRIAMGKAPQARSADDLPRPTNGAPAETAMRFRTIKCTRGKPAARALRGAGCIGLDGLRRGKDLFASLSVRTNKRYDGDRES